jgi:hypothetical protein
MILACGTCTHWITWTLFPAATPWAVIFMVWFLVLSLTVTVARAELTAVPRFPIAFALVLVSVVLGVAIAGPWAGLWFAPSCLLGSAAAVRLASRPDIRRIVLSVAAVAIAVLGGLWVRSNVAQERLSAAERVLLLDGTPAWPVELRRVGRGDCATLELVADRAKSERLTAAAKRRLAGECPGVRTGPS